MTAEPETVPVPLARFTGIRLVHTALRRDLVVLPGRIRGLSAGDLVGAAETAARWRVLGRILMAHQEYEDCCLWPLLRERRPELRLLVRWLAADHRVIERELVAGAAMIGGLVGDARRAPAVAVAVEGFIGTIDAHLRVEGEQVLPELARAVAPGEQIGTLGASLGVIDEAEPFVGEPRLAGSGPVDAMAWLLDGMGDGRGGPSDASGGGAGGSRDRGIGDRGIER